MIPIVIGSPIIYADNLRPQRKLNLKSGTLVFPCHSSEFQTVEYEVQLFIDFLKNLPNKFKPLYVVLYWADIARGLHNIFLRNQFKCFCAGHIFDYNFIFNLMELFRHSKHTITNAFGSHCYYSNFFGNPVFVYKQKIKNNNYLPHHKAHSHKPTLQLPMLYRNYCNDLNFDDFKQQSSISNNILGVEKLYKKEKLLETLIQPIKNL